MTLSPRWAKVLRPRLAVWIGLIALATMSSLFARWFWLAELFSHFLIHLAVALLLLMPLVVVLRAKRLAVLAIMVFGLQMGLLLGHPAESPVAASCRDVRVVQWNVEFTNAQATEGLTWLRSQQADVVVLLEVGPQWLPSLKLLAQDYAVAHLEPEDHPFGLAAFSRLPASRLSRHLAPIGNYPWIQIDGEVDGRPFRVYAVHAPPPVQKKMADARNLLLTSLAKDAMAQSAAMLVGDFNLTPWSPWFDDVLRSGMLDARQGLQATWPSNLGVIGLPLDHSLVTPSLRLQQRVLGPALGSDHLPVVTDLAVGCKG